MCEWNVSAFYSERNGTQNVEFDKNRIGQIHKCIISPFTQKEQPNYDEHDERHF
jgi:hypothetical protein